MLPFCWSTDFVVVHLLVFVFAYAEDFVPDPICTSSERGEKESMSRDILFFSIELWTLNFSSMSRANKHTTSSSSSVLQSALYAEPQPLIGCLRPIAAPTNLKITESGKTGRNQQQRGETQQPITKGNWTKILARNIHHYCYSLHVCILG